MRKILEQHGGRVEGTTPKFTFCDCIYYINRNGIIYYTIVDSELYRWVTKYYHEVKLPNSSECWKPGDIIVNNNYSNEFYVFDKFTEKGNILAYLMVIKNPVEVKILRTIEIHLPYTSFHNADNKELNTFYSLLAARNLTWDAYNKELQHGNHTYFYPKNEHYYFRRNTIRCKDRTIGEWYDAVLYSDANGQYVRELNDFNTKFKKL